MNTVPTGHGIVSNDCELGVLKLSSTPLLLNIPGPIPLTWQLAVPSDVGESVEPSGFVPQRITHMDSTQTPSTQIMVKKHKKAPQIPVDHCIRILQQFGRYNDYDSSSTMVIDGFIRDLQSQITHIIPIDITNICSTFYHENESQYIHFTYKLYQVLKEEKTESISGKKLISIIKNHNLLQNQDNVIKICTHLIEHDLLQLKWFKTTFSSLFDKSSQAVSFIDSDDYVYTISHPIKNAFESSES